jgi:drug/metabolite transporter (DMT)-like permease
MVFALGFLLFFGFVLCILYLLFKQISPNCKPFRDPWFYVANIAVVGAVVGFTAYAWDYVMHNHMSRSR